MSSSERKRVSMSDRWREIATRRAGEGVLEKALATLPAIRQPRVRIRPGSIQTEMEGAMGSINEVSIHAPRLPEKIWPQVVRIMRRSPTMVSAMRQGRVPRAFDRLLLRVCNESVFPDPRRVTFGCTCGSPEQPCPHVLALHELFARRLDERPYELLSLRGVDLRQLLDDAANPASDDLPPLAFGAHEEPVLFPEGEDVELDSVLTVGEIRDLLATHQAHMLPHLDAALRRLGSPEAESADGAATDGDAADRSPLDEAGGDAATAG